MYCIRHRFIPPTGRSVSPFRAFLSGTNRADMHFGAQMKMRCVRYLPNPRRDSKGCDMEIVRVQKNPRDREAYIAAMWLMFLRLPRKQTAPGEAVDLGEIGEAPEKNFERLTPYSLARPIR